MGALVGSLSGGRISISLLCCVWMGIGQTRGTTVVVVDDNDNGEFDVDALIWIRSVGEF